MGEEEVIPPYTGSEFLEISTSDGHILRIVFELSLGDLVVSSVLLLILTFLILRSIMGILWR